MVMLIRFRALPNNQMRFIDDYLKRGKPILGLRNAVHAFKLNVRSFDSGYEHYVNYYNEECLAGGLW